MATLALPLRRSALAGSSTLVPLVIGTIGTLLSWLGSGWDVSWHRMFGRDTFWSMPHVFIYVGVTLWGVAAIVATVTAIAGRPIRGRALRVGALRAELGLALVGVGALVTVLAGPFDEAWHAAFGRDVDIWSPPHLAGIAGGVVGLLGWIAAFSPGVFPISERLRRFLRLVTLGNLCAISIFALNFYYVSAVTREAFFYPLLVIALIPATLGLATFALPGRWAATLVAGAYTAIAILGYALLAGAGWRPPAFPPLVLAGAIAVDLLRARHAPPLILGLAFAVAFVAAELVRMTLFAPPAPTSLLGGAEPRLGALFFVYYEHAVARPWLSAWPLVAAFAGAPLAAVSWIAGRRVGRLLTHDPDSEPFAHP